MWCFSGIGFYIYFNLFLRQTVAIDVVPERQLTCQEYLLKTSNQQGLYKGIRRSVSAFSPLVKEEVNDRRRSCTEQCHIIESVRLVCRDSGYAHHDYKNFYVPCNMTNSDDCIDFCCEKFESPIVSENTDIPIVVDDLEITNLQNDSYYFALTVENEFVIEERHYKYFCSYNSDRVKFFSLFRTTGKPGKTRCFSEADMDENSVALCASFDTIEDCRQYTLSQFTSIIPADSLPNSASYDFIPKRGAVCWRVYDLESEYLGLYLALTIDIYTRITYCMNGGTSNCTTFTNEQDCLNELYKIGIPTTGDTVGAPSEVNSTSAVDKNGTIISLPELGQESAETLERIDLTACPRELMNDRGSWCYRTSRYLTPITFPDI